MHLAEQFHVILAQGRPRLENGADRRRFNHQADIVTDDALGAGRRVLKVETLATVDVIVEALCVTHARHLQQHGGVAGACAVVDDREQRAP
eukprot:488063-Prymnesium_polylepis.2